MSGRRDPYERLLRWYPTSWRHTHGAVFLDTLRDQSEQDGRTSPSPAETFAAVANALGQRLDARLAAVLAVTGIALVALGQLGGEVWNTVALTGSPSATTSIALTTGVIVNYLGGTALVTMGAVAPAARAAGAISGPRAVLVLLTGSIALVLAILAQRARVDGEIAGHILGWIALTGGAVVLGLVASWACIEGLLSRTRLARAPRAALALLGSAILVPVVIEYEMLDQPIWVALGLVVVAVSLRSRGAWPVRQPSPVAPAARAFVRALAGISAAVGLLGIVWATTGEAWSPLATDGESAGQQGVAICLVATLPLVVAWERRAGRGTHAMHLTGPAVLAGLATTIAALGYVAGSSLLEPALYLASVALAAGLAWRAAAVIPGTPRDRWTAAAAAGLACVAADGAALLPVVAFVTPALAVILAIRGDLRRHGEVAGQPSQTPTGP